MNAPHGKKSPFKVIAAGVGGVAVLVVATAYFQAILGVDAPSPGDPADAAQVSLGAQVYGETCAECHGKNLEGQPDWRRRQDDGTLPAPPHDQTGHTWHHADDLLFDYVKHGGQALAPEGFTSAMPGFGEILTDRQIWAVLAFIKSRWPAEVRARQERMNR